MFKTIGKNIEVDVTHALFYAFKSSSIHLQIGRYWFYMSLITDNHIRLPLTVYNNCYRYEIQ